MSIFKRKKDKNQKTIPISYQVVGHDGIRDGAILQPNEKFTRSWTVMNTAPTSSKEKGKVVKLVHSRGHEMKDQLLFLWPVSGKLVTVS